jgi:hypothetical protein
MSLYTENTEQPAEQSCQLGSGVSNIGLMMQPALDKFREGLLEISGSVIKQIKAQRGAGVKRKKKNKTNKQKGSGVIKSKKSGKKKQQHGGGKPRTRIWKSQIATEHASISRHMRLLR